MSLERRQVGTCTSGPMITAAAKTSLQQPGRDMLPTYKEILTKKSLQVVQGRPARDGGRCAEEDAWQEYGNKTEESGQLI